MASTSNQHLPSVNGLMLGIPPPQLRSRSPSLNQFPLPNTKENQWKTLIYPPNSTPPVATRDNSSYQVNELSHKPPQEPWPVPSSIQTFDRHGSLQHSTSVQTQAQSQLYNLFYDLSSEQSSTKLTLDVKRCLDSALALWGSVPSGLATNNYIVDGGIRRELISDLRRAGDIIKEVQSQIESAGTLPGNCSFCGSKRSFEWRNGPAGKKTLCNPCGIQHSKSMRPARQPSKQAQRKLPTRKR